VKKILVLLALTVSACGSGAADAPKDASMEDFCKVYMTLLHIHDDKSMDRWAAQLGEVGTPPGVSDRQRRGFEYVVEETPNDDSDEPSKSVKADVDAFYRWALRTCTADRRP
jgi:hypothetical protein